jgi:hypothetical protein
MHGPIHQHLLGGGLAMLNKLGDEIALRRGQGMPQIGSVFLPTISVLQVTDETQRESFPCSRSSDV